MAQIMAQKLRSPYWASVTRSTQTGGNVRHNGAGLNGVHRATAVPDAIQRAGRYGGAGNPVEKIANTG
jgi:hypothetical protein